MSQLVIVPTDADFEAALGKRFMCGAGVWAQLKSEAHRAAADRLLRDNLAVLKATSESLQTLTGPAWLEAQERFTSLMAEHDELERLAFPEQFQEVSRG